MPVEDMTALQMRSVATTQWAQACNAGTTSAPRPRRVHMSEPLTPRKPPETGSLMSSHAPTDDASRSRARAALHLREKRESLRDYIVDEPSHQDEAGDLKPPWKYKVAAMYTADDATLLEEFGEVPPRRNTSYKSGEEIKEQRISSWGPSPLRYQVQRSADQRAYMGSQRRRRVGGQHGASVTGGEGADAVLAGEGSDVDEELGGLL